MKLEKVPQTDLFVLWHMKNLNANMISHHCLLLNFHWYLPCPQFITTIMHPHGEYVLSKVYKYVPALTAVSLELCFLRKMSVVVRRRACVGVDGWVGACIWGAGGLFVLTLLSACGGWVGRGACIWVVCSHIPVLGLPPGRRPSSSKPNGIGYNIYHVAKQ